MGRDDTAALDWHRGVAVMVKAPPQTVRRVGECPVDIAFRDREGTEEIGTQVLVDDRCTLCERCLGADDRRQFLEFGCDQTSGVFSSIPALGNDNGDGLADMPNLVMRQQRLLRVVEFVLDQACPFARQ